MNFWTETSSNEFLNINYEDLINNQKDEIKKLLSFVN